MKAMNAYFTLNATLYSANAARIMTTLNKRSRAKDYQRQIAKEELIMIRTAPHSC